MDPTLAPSTSGAGVFDSVLGTSALPPPAGDPSAPIAPGSPNGAGAAGLNVPVGPAASPPPATRAASGPPLPIGPPVQTAAGAGASSLDRILGALRPQPQSGFDTPRFMSSLGAGLSSAGQNWNKPAAAAFASGAGAALQGGQSYDNAVQSAKLKALQTAIAAFRAGDVAGYHRSLADYHNALAQQRRQGSGAATPGSQPPKSQSPAAPPAQADQASAAAVAVQPQAMLAHRAALDRLLADVEVPPHRVETADLDSAARLMAAQGMPAADAFEAASLHNAMDAGHVSPAQVDLIYGPGAADAIRSTAAS